MNVALVNHHISFTVRGQNRAEVEEAALDQLHVFIGDPAPMTRVVDVFLDTQPEAEITTPGERQPRWAHWKCAVTATIRPNPVS